jgi:arylsulfatase A-like enzyme
MKRSVLWTCAALLVLGTSAPAAEPRPNVVLILADDLGWADVGFHGSKNQTPNLDRLARNAVELRRQYVNPMCSTTRASLLSGRYAGRFGITGAHNERAFPWETTTLAAALKSAGYETALTGKWHLGSRPDWGPQKFGFDHSYGSLAGGCGPWDHRYKTGEFSRTWHRNGKLIDEEGHVTDLITREALGWLAERKDRNRPFFLYVPFTAVHIPIDEPKKWLDLYPDIQPPSRRQYAACVSHLDDSVGQIVSAIEKMGARDNTLILFLSDNGGIPDATNDDKQYPNADKYPAGPAGGSNTPLRGQKGQLYEGGLRIPALASWPGKLKPGQCEQVIHAVDWMPTLCGLAGFKPAADLKWDGQDVWPMVSGAKAPQKRTVYWAGVSFRSAAVRDGDLKLIVTKTAKPDADRVELFDLAADPNESKDLSSARPEDVARLRKLLTNLAAADNEAKVKAP